LWSTEFLARTPISIQICFDVNWRDEWRHVKVQGAQIVFFPGGLSRRRQLWALALVNEYHVIGSTMSSPAKSA